MTTRKSWCGCETLPNKEKRTGYWRAYLALRKQGLSINHKRVQRLWQLARLQVPPRKRRRRRREASKAVLLQATYPRHVVTYDFMEDSTVDGRKLRCLTIVDTHLTVVQV